MCDNKQKYCMQSVLEPSEHTYINMIDHVPLFVNGYTVYHQSLKNPT